MTYNVFGETLNLTLSICHSCKSKGRDGRNVWVSLSCLTKDPASDILLAGLLLRGLGDYCRCPVNIEQQQNIRPPDMCRATW